jgi:hypothetical protein
MEPTVHAAQLIARARHDRPDRRRRRRRHSGNYLQAAMRNPSAAAGERGMLFLGFAVTEAMGIFALVMAFIILYAA